MDKEKLEGAPPGTVHLDTVRSLHQTVVSLRTALEVSKNELKELKEKYEEHSRCLEYSDIIEKLTLENHILRRKIIDSDKDRNSEQNIKLKLTYSPRFETFNGDKADEVLNTSAESKNNNVEANLFNDIKKCEGTHIKSPEDPEFKTKSDSSDNTSNLLNGTYASQQQEKEDQSKNDISNYKTKLELLSKFDVKIKVKTLKEGNNVSNSTTSDSTEDNNEDNLSNENDLKNINFKEHRKQFEELRSSKGDKINITSVSTENIKMAVPNEAEVKSKTDKFDVQVRITSEDSLVVKENIERGKSKDTLNLDVDSLSLRSLSEGDNSVFSEGVVTPIEPNPTADEKQDQGNASGNESEEVDDIELIFTTDESKDISNLQEDLVSIKETDQWTPASASTAHSTPVLIKFHTLDPDFQPSEDVKTKTKTQTSARESLRMKRVSLPNDKDFKVGFNGKGSLDLPGRGILKSGGHSENMLYRKSPNTSTRRLDSVDSLTCEFNRGLSLDHTKSSSFELGSSLDVLHRDESVDSFYKTKLGHRFSIFAETDISKCGISEDDLASNLNVRRNTCPNPFQYRPIIGHRGLPRTGYKPLNRPRPVLYQGYAARRESSAQTDVSALPPRWTSDGYLAYKIPEVSPPVAARRGGLAPPGRAAAPRSDDARRVLLSDIGFTSMVPELSRSAEPLWSRLQQAHDSPLPRYLSRGSSHRSPSNSNDRSNDWTSHATAHSTQEYRLWRGSLPDVRHDDTEELLQEAETYLRRSIDTLRSTSLDRGEEPSEKLGRPYIPTEARQLRLGHTVKLITPQGRLVVGRVRYVGLAGSSAASSGVVVGAECRGGGAGAGRSDGTHRGRRYFRTAPHHTAVFVPFSKVVMAWAN